MRDLLSEARRTRGGTTSTHRRRRSSPATTSCGRRCATPATSSPGAGARGRRLVLGPAAPPRPREPDARPVRHRAGRVAVQPRAVSRSAAARPSSTRRLGRHRRLRGRPRRRRCGWWSTSADFDESRWVNLTGVSGHPFARTTPTRPTSGPRAGRCRGSSRPRRSGPRPRTRSPCSRPQRIEPGRAGRGQDGPVVRLDRHVQPTSSSYSSTHVNVPTGTRAQGPVVAAAAAAQPVSVAATRRGPGRARRRPSRPPRRRAEVRPARAGPSARARATRVRRTPPSPGRGRAATSGSSTRFPAACSSSSRIPVPGSVPIETYAATVAARRTGPGGRAGAGQSRHLPRRPRSAAGGCGRSRAGRGGPAWRQRIRTRPNLVLGAVGVGPPCQPTIEVWVVQA